MKGEDRCAGTLGVERPSSRRLFSRPHCLYTTCSGSSSVSKLVWWRRWILAAYNRWVLGATYPIYLSFVPLRRPSADREGNVIRAALIFTRRDPLEYNVFNDGDVPPHDVLFYLAITDDQVDRMITLMRAHRD